jgi:hypothetical protein
MSNDVKIICLNMYMNCNLTESVRNVIKSEGPKLDLCHSPTALINRKSEPSTVSILCSV